MLKEGVSRELAVLNDAHPGNGRSLVKRGLKVGGAYVRVLKVGSLVMCGPEVGVACRCARRKWAWLIKGVLGSGRGYVKQWLGRKVGGAFGEVRPGSGRGLSRGASEVGGA